MCDLYDKYYSHIQKNLDDPTEPDLTLHPPSFLVSVEYNPKDPNVLAGGCYNGQVNQKFYSFCIYFK